MNTQEELKALLQNTGIAPEVNTNASYDKWNSYKIVTEKRTKGKKGTTKGTTKSSVISTKVATSVNTTASTSRIKTAVSENPTPDYLKPYDDYIDIVVKNILANNPSFTKTIVRNAKLRQLEYLYQDPVWKNTLQTLQTITDESDRKKLAIHLFELNEMDVYEDDWKESKEHLESYNRLEQLQPNSNEICPDCGQQSIYYQYRQVRSADEGATTFYFCLKCGKQWIQS